MSLICLFIYSLILGFYCGLTDIYANLKILKRWGQRSFTMSWCQRSVNLLKLVHYISRKENLAVDKLQPNLVWNEKSN